MSIPVGSIATCLRLRSLLLICPFGNVLKNTRNIAVVYCSRESFEAPDAMERLERNMRFPVSDDTCVQHAPSVYNQPCEIMVNYLIFKFDIWPSKFGNVPLDFISNFLLVCKSISTFADYLRPYGSCYLTNSFKSGIRLTQSETIFEN